MKEERFLIVLLCLVLLTVGLQSTQAAETETLDPIGDTELINTMPLDIPRTPQNQINAANQPDIAAIRYGNWEPTSNENLFDGAVTDREDRYYRIELDFAGLVNPPGPNHELAFNPTRYGPNPVFGYVEVDMFGHTNGGETFRPWRTVHNNCARWGGIVRLVESYETQSRRSAYELIEVAGYSVPSNYGGMGDTDSALTGWGGQDAVIRLFAEESKITPGLPGTNEPEPLIEEIWITQDDGTLLARTDETFQAGDSWVLKGQFLCRAFGYQEIYGYWPDSETKTYCPSTLMKFEHNQETDETTVSLITPLTNQNYPDEPYDHSEENDHSILESFGSLITYINEAYPSGDPTDTLIHDFAYGATDPQNYFDTSQWKHRAIVGTNRTGPTPDEYKIAYTDILYSGYNITNPIRGDFNGNGTPYDPEDVDMYYAFLNERDQSPNLDMDDAVGCIKSVLPGRDFNLFDTNRDGYIGICPNAPQSADINIDQKVDLKDFEILSNCTQLYAMDEVGPDCVDSDINRDGYVDLRDVALFQSKFSDTMPQL